MPAMQQECYVAGCNNMKRSWIEFFEGDNRQLSMTRLLCFMSWFPASYVVAITKSENALGWYLGAYVTGYVLGKSADVATAMKGGNNAHKLPAE